MIRVGILGAKGYASGEALRWLLGHPEVELTCLMGRLESPEPVTNYHPWLRGLLDRPIVPMDLEKMAAECDVVFLGLPHTVSDEYAPRLIEGGVRIIDLSASFRFDSVASYEATYGARHRAPELNAKFAYALPELFGSDIPGAAGLACPGCYPTAALLELAPLAGHGDAFDLDRIVIDALSGVSGAGRKVEAAAMFAELNESAKAYGVGEHRHRPEIEEKFARLTGAEHKVTFTPHLIPITRGILSTATVPLKSETTTEAVHEMFAEYYKGRPFVRLLPAGEVPSTGVVTGTNFCDIGVKVDAHSEVLIVVSAIDNLAKGTASGAIQAMNLWFELPETLGLLPGRARESRESHV